MHWYGVHVNLEHAEVKEHLSYPAYYQSVQHQLALNTSGNDNQPPGVRIPSLLKPGVFFSTASFHLRIGYLSKVGAAVTAFFAPPLFHLSDGQPSATELAPVKSVAIIGAGAAGSSTAYYLSKFLDQPQLSRKHLDHSITIFEQSDKIGGRCAAFRVRNHGAEREYEYIEVGASIFVEVNYNLVEAAKEFGLKTKPLDDELLAIWDGKEFIFEESQWKFWSILKALGRWGRSPIKMKSLLKYNVGNLLESYKSTEVFHSISGFAKKFKLDTVASKLSHLFLQESGISEQYSKEIIEVATRVNYGSNLDEIHALGTLVSMAAENALQIQDGNFQIFEGMVGRSNAQVRLNTKVARIRRIEAEYDGGESRFEVTTVTGHKEIFDSIVIAAPIDSTNIDFDLQLPPQPKVAYRTIYATFVRGYVNPGYFHATSAKSFPTHILTTKSDAEFTSLSIQVRLNNGETVTKIFSPEPIKEELLDRLYLNRTWVKSKAWKAYPRLQPLPSDVDLDGKINIDAESDTFSGINDMQQDQVVLNQKQKQEMEKKQQLDAIWGQVEVVPGVFYVNAFEALVSTMETETIAGKNVARLVRDRILGYCPVEKQFKP
ncbi:Prenylcysteine lyase-domain-containing protein [Dissophora ornata]|nr:Prenylcysteine lyase-domain-containing protein [Dissophora ornata]